MQFPRVAVETYNAPRRAPDSTGLLIMTMSGVVRLQIERKMTMSDRNAIALLMLIFSLSATPLVANASALCPEPGRLSDLRTAIVDVKALVDKGDLSDARARIKGLDASWGGGAASSTVQPAHSWVVDRAIDRGLDRALFALLPQTANAAMCKKALIDLLAVVDQVRKIRVSANGV
jgi:hypothetical protein